MRRAVFERKIAYHKVGRFLRFRTEDLQAYLNANRMEPQVLTIPGVAHDRSACPADNDRGRWRRLLRRPRSGGPVGVKPAWRILIATEPSLARRLRVTVRQLLKSAPAAFIQAPNGRRGGHVGVVEINTSKTREGESR